ncbi:hypothetical protein AFCDBAGC_1102 [Methylobacterium cerastii]|uniref:GAF domain-containing protein n=2 Tax=Methylobacterium cerastii TaxID=932741 RepID=A0ABQ4QEC6_9HYPH|nr:hypothetical protein AFCDBAGC_1102 [Methylobacterium cerastii]
MGFGAMTDARLDEARARLLTVSDMPGLVVALRETARSIAESDGIAVVLRDGDFCHYVAEDAIRPLWRGRRFRLEACISGWVMLNRQMAVIHDIEADTRLPVAAYQSASMRSLVMMPIGSPEPSAALGAYWSAWVELDDGTVGRLQALADMATETMVRLQAADYAVVPREPALSA